MSYNLIINSTNVANSTNNMFQYNFIKNYIFEIPENGSFEIPENAEMMIT